MQFILVPGIVAGVALGIAFAALNGTADALAYSTREILGLLAMLLGVAVAQAVALRRHPLGREAAFAARYFTAMLAGLVVSVSYGVSAWLYFAVIEPDYLAAFYAEYLARARATGDPAFVENAERMKSFVLDPLSQAMVQFGTTLLISVLAALGTAWLVRPAPDGQRSGNT